MCAPQSGIEKKSKVATVSTSSDSAEDVKDKEIKEYEYLKPYVRDKVWKYDYLGDMNTVFKINLKRKLTASEGHCLVKLWNKPTYCESFIKNDVSNNAAFWRAAHQG
jgi:hypothetical protein